MNDAPQEESKSTEPEKPMSKTESPQVRLMVTALSGTVFLLVAGAIYGMPHQRHAGGPSSLATLNAFLNICATLCLVGGFLCIKKGNIRWHRRFMLAAFGISSMFLLTYLMHHAQVGSVKFTGTGLSRIVYFSLLIPHIILSAVVVPMALLTIYRGWTDRIELHKKLARITLPLWLFVGVSGVIVYYMLYHL